MERSTGKSEDEQCSVPGHKSRNNCLKLYVDLLDMAYTSIIAELSGLYGFKYFSVFSIY